MSLSEDRKQIKNLEEWKDTANLQSLNQKIKYANYQQHIQITTNIEKIKEYYPNYTPLANDSEIKAAKSGRVYTGNVVSMNDTQVITESASGTKIRHEIQKITNLDQQDKGRNIRIKYSNQGVGDITHRDGIELPKDKSLSAERQKDFGIDD